MFRWRSVRTAALAVLAMSGFAARAAAQASTPPATVEGVVYDSVAHRPLASATVQLLRAAAIGARADTSYIALADSLGRFHVEGMLPGHYIIGVFHPALDSLGIGAPIRNADFASGSTTALTLGLPGAATVVRAICGPGAGAGDSTGMLIGHVRDAETGEAIGGATVVVVWNVLVIDRGIRTERRQVPVRTSAEGWYAVCGVPNDGGVLARAEHGAEVSGFIDVVVPSGGIMLQEFGIGRTEAREAAPHAGGDSAAGRVRRGSARLSGTVKNKAGRPLGGAQLTVIGSGATGSVSDAGSFALADLPSGTQLLEVRAIGYAPARVGVTLSTREPRTVSVVMTERVAELDAVTVYGKSNSRRLGDITGFLDRRRGGFGRFFTRDDIEKMYAFSVCDVLRRVPGARVGAGRGGSCDIQFRGATSLTQSCQPTVYLNGSPITGGPSDLEVMVRPEEIAGVEVYPGGASMPMQFSGSCGSIVVWTGVALRSQ